MKKPRNLVHADVQDIYVYRANASGDVDASSPIMILPSFMLGPLSGTNIDLIVDEETGAHYQIIKLALIVRKDESITPALVVQPWAEDGEGVEHI